MQKNSNNLNPEMIKEVEKKTGMNAEELKKAVDSGNISGIVKNFDKNTASKLEKVLSDKESAMKLLSTPKAQALIKKFFGGK